MQATLCLLDARQLSQPRYRDNENFRDQLAAADVILASKNDTYQPEDRWALEARRAQDPLQRPCYTIAQGQADVALLSSRARIVQNYRTRSIIMVRRKRRGWRRCDCRSTPAGGER